MVLNNANIEISIRGSVEVILINELNKLVGFYFETYISIRSNSVKIMPCKFICLSSTPF